MNPRVGWIFRAAIFSIFGAAFLSLWTWDYLGHRALSHGATTLAAVTDHRIFYHGKGPTYSLKYAFKVDPDPTSYTSSDQRGHDVWMSLPQDSWETAVATKTVPIKYAISDPWINEPAETNPWIMRAFLLFGLLCVAMPWLNRPSKS